MSNLESSTSDFTFKKNDIISDNNSEQFGGGILSDLFGNNDMDKLLLETFQEGRPDIACYLLCKTKKSPSSLTNTDETGRNLLHYMSIYASYGNMVIHIGSIFRKTSKSKIKKALNRQDKIGNTPLHYATDLGFNNLVKLYIDSGADATIRNNKGEYIVEDKNPCKSNRTPVDVSIIIPSPQSDERIIDLNNPMILPEFSNTSNIDTAHFVNIIDNELKSRNLAQENMPRENMPRENIQRENIQRENIQRENIQHIREIRETDFYNMQQHEGSDGASATIDTEALLAEIIQKANQNQQEIQLTNTDSSLTNSMVGGAKKSKKSKDSKNSKKSKKLGRLISGERKIVTYSEISTSDKKISNKEFGKLDQLKLDQLDASDVFIKSDKVKIDKVKTEEYTISLKEAVSSNDSNVSDIARQINRQSSEIHERVVLKIIELLKLDKNNESDMQKARNYKAAIYRMVKEKNPLLNNFDRAVEMEKLITLEKLKSIDIDKVSKEIEKHLSEKSSEPKSAPKPKSKSKLESEEKSKKKSAKKEEKSEDKSEDTKKKTKKTKKTKTESSISLDSDGVSVEFSTVSQF
jgi:hypothetical protein